MCVYSMSLIFERKTPDDETPIISSAKGLLFLKTALLFYRKFFRNDLILLSEYSSKVRSVPLQSLRYSFRIPSE